MIDGVLTNEADDDNNLVGGILKIIEKINQFGSSVTGFLINGLKGFGVWSFTALMAQIQSASMFLWNFNFNATDAEIDQQFANFQSVLGGLLGGTIGNALGWLVCGAGTGMVLMRFNKLLAARVLAEVGEEALDEVVANVRMLAMQSIQTYWRWEMLQKFKMGRRAVKTMFRDPNGFLSKAFKLLGGDPAKVKNWGETGSKPWSFALATEAWIESIKSDYWQNFTEELIEEFFDSCSEAFYVVAGAADQYMLEQKLSKAATFGAEEILEISPNRDLPNEKIVLAGPQELIKPVIVQTLIHHQLLENRDVGMWVGEPVRENLKAPPISIQMRILMSGHQSTLVGQKRVQITIPDVDRSKIDWENIKLAVGGINGYMWGRFKGSARLEKGNKIELYADTSENAVELLTRLAVFSNQEIVSVNVYEEKKEGKRKTISALYKDPTRIYPYGFTILNQQKVLNEESGIAQLSGVYRRSGTQLIDLTSDTRPDDFSETIAELFRIPGQND
jgi:hypothetical protein